MERGNNLCCVVADNLGVTQTTKNAEVLILRIAAMKFFIQGGGLNRLRWASIQHVNGGVESFCLVGWRHMSLKKKSANDVINSANGTFGLPVLWRCILAREV